jgi:hypothetical protein
MAAQIFPCQTVGWPLSADARGEESPGSTEVRCRVTPGGGDPRESATESTPPACLRLAGRAARVKWCGKSAPRRRQRRRQGKPHREQDQIGAAGTPEQSDMPGEPPRRRSGRSQEALGDERPRGMAITAPGGYARGGTEPGLYAVWRPVPVDDLADQTGISDVSGGQPCGRPNSLLHVKADRVASLIVWSTRGVRDCDPEIGSEAGSTRAVTPHSGGRCGRSDRVARSFFGIRFVSDDRRHHGGRCKSIEFRADNSGGERSNGRPPRSHIYGTIERGGSGRALGTREGADRG